MKKSLLSLGAFALAAALFFTSCSENEDIAKRAAMAQRQNLTPDPENGAPISGKYIVRFNEGQVKKSRPAGYSDALAMTHELSGQVFRAHHIRTDQIDRIYASAIWGFSASLTDAELKTLQQDAQILSIEPDRVIALPQAVSSGTVSASAAQTAPWGIVRVGGGQTYTGTAKAWVIDTGIDLTHPDLKVNASLGTSVFTTGKDKSLNDGNGHGTHCAGTIAAINNSIGVVGVAAGATVVPVKVLNSRGSGSTSGVLAGIDFVAGHAAAGDVANLSLGGSISDALDAAVINLASKGVKVAVAAGNESNDANTHSPARAEHANIYTISAMDSNDQWAYFSNYGNPPIDFCAPGYNVYSTWMSGSYNTISGTSMATPHVAGLLLWGTVATDGYVIGDPDNKPDPIAHR